jgi:hypothetical protein
MDQILARSSRQCHLMMTRYKKAISADVTSAMKTGFFFFFYECDPIYQGWIVKTQTWDLTSLAYARIPLSNKFVAYAAKTSCVIVFLENAALTPTWSSASRVRVVVTCYLE